LNLGAELVSDLNDPALLEFSVRTRPLNQESTVSGSIAKDLAAWGPGTSYPAVGLRRAESYCRGLCRRRYENFPIVGWTIPRQLRQAFYNVYSWCRWADDLADEIDGSERALELLDWWQGELEACYAGVPRHPVPVALARTVRDFGLPRQPFDDLLVAFRQDQRVHSYSTFEQLLEYCRHSANPVGRIVLVLCGVDSEQAIAESDAICTGLQLANFWQDVGRDHAAGRVYLPREDRLQYGYDDESLAARETNRVFRDLMRFEVNRAREYFCRGWPLARRLPGRLQVVIDLFARGGLTILDRIESIDFDVWATRPVLRRRDLARMVSLSFGGAAWRAVTGRRVREVAE